MLTKLKEKITNKLVGRVGLILGGTFVVLGILFFVLLNTVNLYSQKTIATIISRTVVKTDEPYTFLDLAYRVGDEMVYTTSSFREEIPEDQFEIEIYYNIKDPKVLEDGGWNFQPLAIIGIGFMIAFVGIYYIKVEEDNRKVNVRKSSSDLSKWEDKFKNVKERFESDGIMLIGSVSLLIFGIVIKIVFESFWPWIIIAISGIATIYILIDFIPVVKEYFTMKGVRDTKRKVVSVDDDFEKFEKEQETRKILEGSNEDGFEIEETYEIKNIKKKGKKK